MFYGFTTMIILIIIIAIYFIFIKNNNDGFLNVVMPDTIFVGETKTINVESSDDNIILSYKYGYIKSDKLVYNGLNLEIPITGIKAGSEEIIIKSNNNSQSFSVLVCDELKTKNQTITLNQGETKKLNFNISNECLTKYNIDITDKNVVTYNNGTISALKKGTTNLIISKDNVKYTYKIVVKAISLKFTSVSKTLEVSTISNFKLSGIDGSVTCNSSNQNIATAVFKNNGCEVTAKAIGNATITATSKTNSVKAAINVIAKGFDIKLGSSSYSLKTQSSVNVPVTLINATNKAFTCATKDNTIATAQISGTNCLVKGLKAGTTTLIVTASGKVANATIIVQAQAATITKYTVTFNSNGGSAVASQTVESGKTATQPANPTRSGYTFNGWYNGSTKFNFSTSITSNLTLTANWTANPTVTKYTVTFNSNGGSAVASQTVESGKTATQPANPTRSGYTFNGWYNGSTKFNFSTPITSNLTLTANWTANPTVTKYTVTFNSNGGSAVASQTVESGKTATQPANPTKSGYTFNGWYNGSTKFNFSTKITSNLTLTANWTANVTGTKLTIGTFNVGYFECGSLAESGFTRVGTTKCTKASRVYKIVYPGGQRYEKSIIDPNLMAESFKSNSLDIIGVQESHISIRGTGYDWGGEYLANAILPKYGKTAEATKNWFMAGFVPIYSPKYTIKSYKNILVSSSSGRRDSKIVITVNGVDISIYNAHQGLGSDNETTFSELAKVMKDDPNPIIAMGDWNITNVTMFNKYLLPLGFGKVAQDTTTYNMWMNASQAICDSIWVKPKGSDGKNHISYVSQKTVKLFGELSDHNMVVATVSIY